MDLNKANQAHLLAERDQARRRLRELVDAVNRRAENDMYEDAEGFRRCGGCGVRVDEFTDPCWPHCPYHLAAEIDKELKGGDADGI